MRFDTVAVWSLLAIAGALWTGCGSEGDPGGSQAGAAGTAGGGGAAGQGMFDPSEQIATAFAHARQVADPLFTDPVVRIVEVNGVPSAAGLDYAHYRWNFVFVGEESGGGVCKGVELAYPGWTAEVIDGTPLGAYMDESEFPNIVKVSFSEMVDKAGLVGVTADACAHEATPVGYVVSLRGSTNPTAPGWFWEFYCPANDQTHRFAAATGEKVGE